MNKWTEHEEGLAVEYQGPFAPERLNETTEGDVFTRRFFSADVQIDIAAAPVKCECEPCRDREDSDPEMHWDVEVITEQREAGDDTGNTSEYEYDYENVMRITYAEAVEAARAYVVGIDPERDFG